MFSHILVPLDGSTAAEAALAFANLLPARTISLITVLPRPAAAGYDWETEIADEEHREAQRAHAQAYLQSVSARVNQRGRVVHTHVVEGDPTEAIAAAADHANLIVMTNHGHGSESADDYGQVVDRIARHAAKPVFVVRGDMAANPAIKRIVVPLDGSDTAEEAVPLAAELAVQIGTPLRLISVIDPALVPTTAIVAATEHARGYLASECERVRSHASDVGFDVLTGTPAAELIAASETGDVIVMTAFGAGTGQRWLLGGVAGKLIRSAPAPVLVVRPIAAG